MTARIEPALSAEEWKTRSEGSLVPGLFTTAPGTNGEVNITMARPHALAALCLVDKPFGFTQEDVALLRNEAESEWNGAEMETGRHLLALAARIAALLPPDEDQLPGGVGAHITPEHPFG